MSSTPARPGSIPEIFAEKVLLPSYLCAGGLLPGDRVSFLGVRDIRLQDNQGGGIRTISAERFGVRKETFKVTNEGLSQPSGSTIPWASLA